MRIRDEREKGWWWAENEIIDRDDLTIYEKMAYIVLCRHADRESRCYPSTKTVAIKMKCSHRQAKEVLKNLREKQLIGTRHRISARGDKTSNEYTIYSAKVKGVVHQDHDLGKDLSDPSAPNAAGVVQNMHLNNTNIEQHSNITTTDGVDVVVSEYEKMEEEYNENTIQVSLKSKTVQQIIKRYTPKKPWEFYHAAWILNWMMRPDTYNYKPQRGYENVLCGMLKLGVIHPTDCPTPSEAKQQELAIAAKKKAAEIQRIKTEAEDKLFEAEFNILPDEFKQKWRQKAQGMGLKKKNVIEVAAYNLWKEDSLRSEKKKGVS